MDEKERRVNQNMREQAELWSGLLTHDEVAAHQVALICDTWKSLVSLRGVLSFDDQPADFDAALRLGKRKGAHDLGK